MAEQTLRGGIAVFNCSAHADPTHSLRWEREGIPITEFLSPDDDDSSVEAFAKLANVSTERGVSVVKNSSKYHLAGMDSDLYGQLMIFDTEINDTQNYTCIIANGHGNLSVTVPLTVQGKS